MDRFAVPSVPKAALVKPFGSNAYKSEMQSFPKAGPVPFAQKMIEKTGTPSTGQPLMKFAPSQPFRGSHWGDEYFRSPTSAMLVPPPEPVTTLPSGKWMESPFCNVNPYGTSAKNWPQSSSGY